MCGYCTKYMYIHMYRCNVMYLRIHSHHTHHTRRNINNDDEIKNKKQNL